jgi:hypothetical protein
LGAENQISTPIFDVRNQLITRSCFRVFVLIKVRYSVDLGSLNLQTPVKSRLYQLGSNPFLSATQCPVSGHFLFNESVRAANKRVKQKMNRATKERALD